MSSIAFVPRSADSLKRFASRYGVVTIIALLVGLLTVFIYRGRSELLEALGLISSVGPGWFVALLSLYLVVLSSAAIIYRHALRRLGHDVGLLRLAEIQLQRVVVGTVTPLGGPPSLYVMIRSLARHHVPAGDSLLTASARSFATLSAFALLLPPALLLQKPATATLAGASVLILLLTAMLVGFIVLLRGSALSAPIERRIPDRLRVTLDAVRQHNVGFRDLIPALAMGIVWHSTMATMLFVSLLAVGYQASIATVLVGYVAGNLMVILAPIFRGVGVVELAMALALQQAGVPAVEAVGAALLFRVGDLWIPLIGGSLVHATRLSFGTDHAAGLRGFFGRPASSAAFRWIGSRRDGKALRAAVPGLITVVVPESVSTEAANHYAAMTPDWQRAQLGPLAGAPPAHPPIL